MNQEKITFTELNRIKSLDEGQLLEYLDFLCDFYKNKKTLVSKLENIIVAKGLNFENKPKQIIFSAALAIILGDIGTQMSPQIRDQNIQKIKNICVTNHFNYEIIKSLTEAESEINLVLQQEA